MSITDVKKILARRRDCPVPAVLATVVKVQGSTYRRPGARMLIEETGETVGLVSGGCLDVDLLTRARAVLHSHQPVIVSYDSTHDDQGIWGLELACPGRLHVLLEPVDSPACRNLLSFVSGCLNRSANGIVATVISSESQGNTHPGERLLINTSGVVDRQINDEILFARIYQDAEIIMRTLQPAHRTYEHADNAVEVFFEVVHPPVSLVIFGAGPDAVPLAHGAAALGWDVSVIDHRPAFATPHRFPYARTIVAEREVMPEEFSLAPDTVAVIMTHNFSQDLFYLKHLLRTSVRYIGLLGPTSKSAPLLQRLCDDGVDLSKQQRERLFTPAGLDIGSETPEEIALAILAEIQAVLHNRAGGFLRARKGPIH
jgi:xanthine dehydrogenase accessory factor